MLKKIVCLLFVFCFLLTFNVSAKEDFYVYGEDNREISEVLNIAENDLEKYCKDNGITYLAVNGDNTKQIKKAEVSDAFSKEIIDFSVLDDNEILELTKELTAFENAVGEVVNFKNRKFLKCELKTSDSGGEYILTQYITVKDAKKTVLTFYTDANADREYIQNVFEEQFESQKNYKPLVIGGIILFSLLGLAVLVLIIKELRKTED